MKYLRKIHVPDIEDYNVDKQKFWESFLRFPCPNPNTDRSKNVS